MRKLLDAAMEAFSTRGYHATRINDIVSLARTSHGTFYLYFTNKEDILRALVSEALSEPWEYYAPLAETKGPLDWEALREWVGYFSTRWTRAAPLFRAWTELVNSDRELGQRARQTMAGMSKSLGRFVARSGSLQGIDPEVAGMAMYAMLDRFHNLRRTLGQPVGEAELDALTTILHRAFFAPPAEQASPGSATRAHARPASGASRRTRS